MLLSIGNPELWYSVFPLAKQKMDESHTCQKFSQMYDGLNSDPKLRLLLESVTNDMDASTLSSSS